jgi:tetratricopeptide (TPR) repeat protein
MDANRKLLEILLDLHDKRRSGILRIQKELIKKQLVLHNGLLAFAESNLPQEHLARIMVAMSLLPRGHLNDIASSMKTGKTSEEAILTLSGLGMQELEKARREQAIVILSSVLGWNDYELRFFPGDSLVRHQLNLGLALPGLIALSARHAASKHLLKAPPQFFSKTFSKADDFAGKASVFPLNRIELYACSLLETPMKAEDIFPLMPAGEAPPEDILHFLFILGMIALSDTGRNEGATAATGTGPDHVAQQLEERLHRFESASLYEMLSIPANANQEEIQTAYHTQAKQLHPDRFQSAQFSQEVRNMAEKVFAHINEAYHTLRTRDSRAEYDRKRSAPKGKKNDPKTGAESPAETAEALFREGRNLLAKGNLETAVERLKGSVWLCPEKASYHFYLGVAESEIPKLWKDAEQHLLKAIEIEDMSAHSHLALAKLYMKVHLPRKAELQLHQALLWDRDNSEALKLAAELKKLH